ncbi:phosphotransferase [Candidatus Nomurabacteria bacterium]|nr:phosphotransferase [Candidatus Nomurabacteria bacterium]
MEELLTKIEYLYGLRLEWFEKVTKGFLSENHVLIDNLGKKKYFLKRYRFDKEEKIKQIHIAKNFFYEKGIPVIIPLKNKEEKTFFYFDNTYFALFPFIEPKHLDRKQLSDNSIISLGKMLANIHLAGKNTNLPINEKFEGWNKDKLLNRIEELKLVINNHNDFDILASEDISLRKSIISLNSITFENIGLSSDHLIHGDYHGGNVFFDEKGEVSYVFDFEKTLYAPRMFELFRSLVFIFFGDSFSEENILKAKLYLRSYIEVYPASKEELEKGFLLFYLRFVHGLWVQTEHYLKNNNRVDQFLKQDYERIKYLSENLDELTIKLLE